LQHRDAADARALRVVPVEVFEPSTEAPQRRLLFIVGMPRSGTTLIEQVLSRHPHVTALGELDFFDQALIRFGRTKTVSGSIVDAITSANEESLEQIRAAFFARIDRHTSRTDTTVVEKTPANFMFLGLINRLFPNAKVIHCRRNPMDTCLSIFFQLFSTGNFYAYEPATIVAMYGAYRDLMDHWSHSLALEIHDLDYESFVQAREEQTRVLLDFCALQWDPQCLAPDTTDGPVTTASRWQVRQPVTTARIERWRNYEPFVDAFKRRLERYLG
jgi:hypothetical protein